MRDVSRVLVVGVLVADGLRGIQIADFASEPCSSVLASGFTSERQPPFPEMLIQEMFVLACHVSDRANAQGVQLLLCDLAYARNVANVERREKFRLLPGHDVENTMWLCFA